MPEAARSIDPEIPCAQSEPRDIEDTAISGLIRLAGEIARWKTEGQTASPIPVLVGQMQTAMEQDAGLACLMHDLPEALGSGMLLQSVFLRLFPSSTRPIAYACSSENPAPQITPREREVLLEMAKGRSKKEIAEHLFLSANTVKSYFNHLYAKLEANSPPEAVAKAAALGLLTFDMAELILPMVDGKNLDLTYFAGMLLDLSGRGIQRDFSDPVRRLAVLGLLLFLAAPLVQDDTRSRGLPAQPARSAGIVMEFTPEGQPIRAFEGGCLYIPWALDFAPPSAARHGFTPGSLYVLNWECCPDALNLHSIVELAYDGKPLRAFTGGAYLSTRLNEYDMAFAADGRLMACAGSMTDAILEFTEGGESVRRFVDVIPHGGVTTDRRGQVYVAGGRWYRGGIYVYNARGVWLRTVGAAVWEPGERYPYRGIAVDEAGNVYISNFCKGFIEVYDGEGRRIGKIRGGELKRPWRIAFHPNGCLYALDGDAIIGLATPEEGCHAVRVFHAVSGAFLLSIPAPPGVLLTDVDVGPNGNLFVSGYRA